MIERLWHSTAMDASYAALHDPLTQLFGAVVMHDADDPEPPIARRGGMIWLGDNSIEIGAPSGDQSPIHRFVREWGSGMHSLALGVVNAADAQAHLAAHEVRVSAFLGDDIFFTNPKDTAGLLLEFSATHTDDDPRWGFPLSTQTNPPVVDVAQYAFVTAVVADPVTVARRLAALFSTSVLRSHEGARADEVAAVVDLGDCLLLLFPMPSADESRQIWGQSISRNRFHAHGLRVPDLDTAVAALRTRGVDVVRTIHGMAYLDPTCTGVPTFLVGELLPEDPRLLRSGFFES